MSSQPKRTLGAQRRRRKPNGEGFTLLELMIALLILGIVLGAVAPAFYGVLRAGSMTNYKSVANGIAVQSTEQMRSYAYYEVGFYTNPTGCPDSTSTTPPVLLSSSVPAPLANLPSTQVVGPVTYTILRCVNWADSTVNGETLAYKRTYVKVSWSLNGASASVAQLSALYPGGNGVYTTGGENDWAPAVTTTTVGTAPSAPSSVTVTTDTGYLLDVSWSAVTGVTCYNIWFSQTNPGSNPVSTMSDAQEDGNVCGTSTTIDVTPSTNYYIQVVAFTTGGTSTPTSATQWPINSGAATTSTTSATTTTTTTTLPSGSTTTTSTSTTTTSTTSTTTPKCSATGITVSPAGLNSQGNQAYLNKKNDNLIANSGSFYVTVTVSGTSCTPQVAYSTTGCTPGSTGCTTLYLSSYTVSGSQYTFLTPANTVWTPKVLQQFVPVVGGTLSTTYSAQSYTCEENGSSGNCS